MRGRTPRYSLARIKAAFADAARLNRTMSAAEGAEELGMDEQAVVDVIASLTAEDFEKSMPSDRDPAIRQDVYKPVVDSRELYVKFTLDAQGGCCSSASRRTNHDEPARLPRRHSQRRDRPAASPGCEDADHQS
jgi:motility quorum-sensing regulator / GCU-specific mRNA interferase toxin